MYIYVTDYIPWGKTYCFSFDKYDCYFRRKGKCSLSYMEFPHCYKRYEKWEKEYCPTLASSILQQGFFTAASNVSIVKNICGHYTMNEGQHRVCVCAKMMVPIKVQYQESNEECVVCSGSKYSIIKKISYLFRREKQFLMKL